MATKIAANEFKEPAVKTEANLRFKPLFIRNEEARVVLMLCNMTCNPISFKLKSEIKEDIVASPSRMGVIGAHSTIRLILTWRRAPPVDWMKVAPQAMILETSELDEERPTDPVTSTPLMALVEHDVTCTDVNPHIEQFFLDHTLAIGSLGGSIRVKKVESTDDAIVNQYFYVTTHMLVTAGAVAILALVLLFINASHPLKQ